MVSEIDVPQFKKKYCRYSIFANIKEQKSYKIYVKKNVYYI